jgi:hypothetical protein
MMPISTSGGSRMGASGAAVAAALAALASVAMLASALTGCATAERPFALRAPMTRDTDTTPVTVACRPDPSPKDPARIRCAPADYVSPQAWDYIDNALFEPVAQALSVEAVGEAVNANSMDEVADSAWFENRIGARELPLDEIAAGGCRPEDVLSDEAPRDAWVIDSGKANGASFGFRVNVPGKGRYMLKTESQDQPEHANAAAVIGAAIYHAIGFHTTCEQVIYIRRDQLRLTPGLVSANNYGVSRPFDAAALDTGLSAASKRDGRLRLTASKWLSGLTLGPFRYLGVRDDDPNDIIPHEHRRDLRGSKLVAAWLNHWDAREQNTMDVWIASDPKRERSSPGHVRHYILDTSDVIGQAQDTRELARRMGHSYYFDFGDFLLDFATFGVIERPWDRARETPGHERFVYFSARDFDPERWKAANPVPAFSRMTERDAAWMARIIARFTRPALEAIVAGARFSNPADGAYVVDVLMARRQAILERYLTRLSPLAQVERTADGRICAVDLARAASVFPADRFRYAIVEQAGATRTPLAAELAPDGAVCFAPRTLAPGGARDDDPVRRTVFHIHNGTAAGPLEIHAYDLGGRGMQIVGLRRPAP